MANLPQFIPQYLGESAQTTILNVIKVLNATLKQLTTIFTYLNQKQILNSVLLSSINVKSGLNQIPHTLGRPLTGWQITGQSASCSFYDEQANNPQPTVYLYLVASAPCTISLLVF